MSTPPELEEVQEDFNMGIICAQQVLATLQTGLA